MPDEVAVRGSLPGWRRVCCSWSLGAMVNAIYLISDWDSFAGFGDMSQVAFVRQTWGSLVVPNTGFFIGLLIAGEAAAGLLVLSGGCRARAGLLLLLAFHAGLLVFGWWLWLYAVPMLAALTVMLRAEQERQPTVVGAANGALQHTERGSRTW
ncbi:MAG: hypothetical protein ABIS35_12010 [Terracoccus sp.]